MHAMYLRAQRYRVVSAVCVSARAVCLSANFKRNAHMHINAVLGAERTRATEGKRRDKTEGTSTQFIYFAGKIVIVSLSVNQMAFDVRYWEPCIFTLLTDLFGRRSANGVAFNVFVNISLLVLFILP